MSLLTQVSIPDALIIFFLTLGPLKALGPFAKATQGADPGMLRALAWRATAIAIAIVIGVAFLGAVMLAQWRVSVAAMLVAGSIILFCQSFQLIMAPPATAPPPIQPQGVEPAPVSLALASFPLAVPALVTAPGITAIAAFMAIAGADWTQRGVVVALLLFIMALNLIALLNVRLIFQYVSPTFLMVLGWVMAVLQAALAVQYLFNGLARAGVLRPLGF
jgi:multiple antibiotic resistance protein